MAMLEYILSLDKINWTNISGLINSKNTSITQNLCTAEFKSAIDTASIQLVPSADVSLWSDVLSILMDEDTIYAKISNEEKVLFFGVVDKSNLSIETKESLPHVLLLLMMFRPFISTKSLQHIRRIETKKYQR